MSILFKTIYTFRILCMSSLSGDSGVSRAECRSYAKANHLHVYTHICTIYMSIYIDVYIIYVLNL